MSPRGWNGTRASLPQLEHTAENILTGQGLSVRAIERTTTDQAEDGLVTRQAPTAGTRAHQGDRVTIFVAKFVAPTTTTSTTSTTPTVPKR